MHRVTGPSIVDAGLPHRVKWADLLGWREGDTEEKEKEGREGERVLTESEATWAGADFSGPVTSPENIKKPKLSS